MILNVTTEQNTLAMVLTTLLILVGLLLVLYMWWKIERKVSILTRYSRKYLLHNIQNIGRVLLGPSKNF